MMMNRGTASESIKKKGTWPWPWIAAVLVPLIASLFIPPFSKVSDRSPVTKAINNCKQVVTTLKLYSADCNGSYPDHDLPKARTSNDVFRLCFKSGVADSEVIFGCPFSSDGRPDGSIGIGPDYSEAVKAGENHWAMTKGLTDSSSGRIPLVYESPADATWPPKWNPNSAGTDKPGRTWSDGKVIIGFNDGSVEALPLESTKGERVGLRPRADGTPIFPANTPEQKFEVLDVAR